MFKNITVASRMLITFTIVFLLIKHVLKPVKNNTNPQQ